MGSRFTGLRPAPLRARARGARPHCTTLLILACLASGTAAGMVALAPVVRAAGDATSPEAILASALEGFALERYERVALTIYRDEADDDGLTRALELYISPSPDGVRIFGSVVGPAIRRGTTFLVLPAATDPGEPIAPNQYFAYLPQTGRVRRLSGSQRDDAFFGSHLSLGDFELHPATHFRVTSMREDTLDPGSPSEERVFRLTIEPRFEAGYARAELWIATADRALLRTEQYSGDADAPLRTIEARREWLDPFERSLLPGKRVIRSTAPGRTELEVIERSTTIEIPDSTFTHSHMRRGGR